MVWIHIRTDILSVLNWVQIVCNGYQQMMKVAASNRVGSHVVFAWIHCTEKWRTSFHTDVLSKSK